MMPIRIRPVPAVLSFALAFALLSPNSHLVAGPIQEGATVYVAAEKVELQKQGAGVVAVAKKGDKLKVLKISGTWVGVELITPDGSKKGWVKKDTVSLEQPVVAEAPEPVKEPEPTKEPEPEKTAEPEEKTSTKAPASGTKAGGSWPQWRGPNRDGISKETGLLKEWATDGPPLLWTARGMGPGYGSVAVANGLIYTAGNVGSEMKMTAVSLDGKIKWQESCGPAFRGGYAGSRGTPTIEGGRAYYETPDGNVACLDAATGRQVWSVNVGQKFRAQKIGWALSESVLIDGDNVICTPGGRDAGVVALNKNTGDTVWVCKELSDKAGYSSPIAFEFRGVRQIVQMTGHAAVGIHARTGRLLWRHPHKTAHDANIPTPIFYKGTVFIDSGYGSGGGLLKLDVSSSRASVSQPWRTRDLDNHHGGVVLVDGYLYGSSHSNQGGKWVCVDIRTGRTMHTGSGVGKGSVTYADGMLYTLNEKGTMGLVPATPRGHKVVGQFQLPRGGSGQSWAHPVVCGGRLYIRHGDALHAFDIKAK